MPSVTPELDAVADGFDDLAELQDRLRFHYPDIKSSDEVTIVHFRHSPP
ncbi:hypothetical protein GCM10020254_04010 [Streptomyces goshikiensis]